jgi:tyrosine-protein kinase Etk/Wzc
MCAKISDILTLLTDKEKDNSPSFRDNLNRQLYHWPLFLIGIIFCLSGAYLYVQRSVPIYAIKATIIIKDQTKDPEGAKKEDLQEIDLSNSSKLAENEIEVLKSWNLISQVVDNLQLWLTYQLKNNLKVEDLYKRSPVKFKLLQKTDSIHGQSLTIIVKDNNSFFIKQSDANLTEFPFNKTLKNNFGIWKLEPTENLLKYTGSEIKIILNDQNKIAENYQKAIEANLPNKLAPAIELTLNDEVELRGKDILNNLINLYNITTANEKNLITQRTLDFIDKRISDLAGELNHSESAVEGYRSTNGLTNISSQSQVYLQNVQTNDNKLNEVNVQLNVIENIERYINSTQDTQNVPSTLGITDAALNSSIGNLSSLQLKREQLLSTTPVGNPMFETIDRQIRALKRSIKENVQNIKSSLLASKDKLQSFNSKFESSIRNIPVQERGLIDKTRQQTIKENLYVYLLQKREEVSLNYASIISDARIVDHAYTVSSRSSQKSLVYGIAMLLGLILPSGFIYVRNSINDRVTTAKEVEEATGMTVFGELSDSNSASPTTIHKKGDIAAGEDFRALRTNLHFLHGKLEKGYAILVTSSISKEGKSFVSSNLGVVLAISGKKTIILEMDLRKPKISKTFKLPSAHPGISDYLIDNLPIDAIVQNSGVQVNLDILGCGHLPSDPSELLELESLDYLIEQLRLRYDYIIIDTPPINLVTDAKIVSRVSDLIFYVTRQGYTYKSLLVFIRSLSKDPCFLNMKILFNGVEKGKYGYNYGDYYYRKIAGGRKASVKTVFKSVFKRF